jgi:hypothetical protein
MSVSVSSSVGPSGTVAIRYEPELEPELPPDPEPEPDPEEPEDPPEDVDPVPPLDDEFEELLLEPESVDDDEDDLFDSDDLSDSDDEDFLA